MLAIDVIISAFFSLMLIVVFTTIGLKIIQRYRTYKMRALLFMGIAWIGLSQLWWSSFLTVLLVLLNISNEGLTPELYVLLSVSFIPFTGLFYVTAITDLTMEKYQRYLQLAVIIFGAIFEIICFYAILSNNSELFLKKNNAYDVENSILSITLLSIFLVSFLILGFLFAFETFKSSSPEIKLKGRFLILAYICFSFGAAVDMLLTNPVLDFLDRLILTISAIIFYWGFTLPKWIKTLFLKE